MYFLIDDGYWSDDDGSCEEFVVGVMTQNENASGTIIVSEHVQNGDVRGNASLVLIYFQRVMWVRALCAFERARRVFGGGGVPLSCPKVFEDCTIWALAQSAPLRWSGSWRRGDFA